MPTDTSAAGEEAADSLGTPVPLTILTGFLGAGKTTLLNRLVNGVHGLRVAVLVNDFGSVNIDAELVVGVEDDMISLANGCVCCEIRDDLIGAVQRLVESVEPPEHIVLEASGVADPAGIWATFAESGHPEWVRLDGVVCVVDTEQIFTHLDEAPELLMLKMRQIGFADLVLLNKVDLAGPDIVAWVRQWIETTMNRVRVIQTTYAEVPLAVLLGADRREPASAPITGSAGQPGSGGPPNQENTDHDHGLHGTHREQFQTWTFETDRLFDPAALREMIRLELPGDVYRCKGFVTVEADPAERMLLQAVGRRSELTPHTGAPGASGTPASRIVAIGASGWDETGLREAFERCLVS